MMRGSAPRLVILAAAGLVTVGARAADQTFSSRVEAVRVDVLVTERGRPVRDLRPSDFEVLDNGVRQQVELASFEQIPLNVVLAFDLSDSVAGDRLAHLTSAGQGLLDGLTKDDRAALVSFSHSVALRADLTHDIARVRAALQDAQPAGLTSLIDACFTAIAVGESDVGRPLLIVYSDGLETSSWLTATAVMDVARRSDAVVYAVTAGRARGRFLGDLSAATGGRLFEVESTSRLNATFREVLDEFRQRYLLSYTPRGVARDGWHRLDVRVRSRRVTVRARPGYLAGP